MRRPSSRPGCWWCAASATHRPTRGLVAGHRRLGPDGAGRPVGQGGKPGWTPSKRPPRCSRNCRRWPVPVRHVSRCRTTPKPPTCVPPTNRQPNPTRPPCPGRWHGTPQGLPACQRLQAVAVRRHPAVRPVAQAPRKLWHSSPGAGTMSRTEVILHVDMDAFYASVEMARRPELRDVPMYVGGAERGVVGANYPARAYGIEEGRRPGLVGSARRRSRWCAARLRHLHRRLGRRDPTAASPTRSRWASIDEAFCDITGAIQEGANPGRSASCCAPGRRRTTHPRPKGIGRFIAKLASKQAKPDGLVEVPSDRITAFPHPLPVEAIWGWGRPLRPGCTSWA